MRSAFDWDSKNRRWSCRNCKRIKARGLCIDCPAPLPTPTARRCAACQVVEQRRRWRVAYEQKVSTDERRKRYNRRCKVYRRRPEQREKNKKRCKAWNQAHPTVRDDAQRLYEREKMRGFRARKRAERLDSLLAPLHN